MFEKRGHVVFADGKKVYGFNMAKMVDIVWACSSVNTVYLGLVCPRNRKEDMFLARRRDKNRKHRFGFLKCQ